MNQKFLDLAGLTAYDKMLKEWFKAGVVDITEEAIRALFVISTEGPADNEIWYKTYDKSLMSFYDRMESSIDNVVRRIFDANIISNTYDNEWGVIKFDKTITNINDTDFYGDSYSMIIDNVTELWLPKTVCNGPSLLSSLRKIIVTINKDSNIEQIGRMGGTFMVKENIINLGDLNLEDYNYLGITILDNEIENAIGTIGENIRIFRYNKSVEKVTIPSNVKYIQGGGTANSLCINDWYYLPNLKEVIFEGPIYFDYGDYSPFSPYKFKNCKIEKMTFIGNIDYYLDWGQPTQVTFPESLKEITLGAGITRIDSTLFFGLNKLETINYTGTIDEWNNITINGNLTDYVSVTSIHCTDGDITL